MATIKTTKPLDKPALAAAPVNRPVQPSKVRVKSIVGLLIHPFTLINFTDEPVDVEVDWWVKNQYDAGKLIYVSD